MFDCVWAFEKLKLFIFLEKCKQKNDFDIHTVIYL